jgi:hypothetical protein
MPSNILSRSFSLSPSAEIFLNLVGNLLCFAVYLLMVVPHGKAYS